METTIVYQAPTVSQKGLVGSSGWTDNLNTKLEVIP